MSGSMDLASPCPAFGALKIILEFCMLGEGIGTVPRFFIILEGSDLETFVFDIF
jgi:hypothetical protein